MPRLPCWLLTRPGNIIGVSWPALSDGADSALDVLRRVMEMDPTSKSARTILSFLLDPTSSLNGVDGKLTYISTRMRIGGGVVDIFLDLDVLNSDVLLVDWFSRRMEQLGNHLAGEWNVYTA